MLYVFYVDTNGHISYVMTDGAYNSSSSSTPAYGLSWLPSQTIMTPVDSGPAYAQCSPGIIVMPPLDSPGDPDQLYVFWQGAGNSGELYYATLGTTSGWSEATQIVPAGCSAGQAIMSQSPSAVVYAPEGSSSSQVYVFYQQSGSSGKPGSYIGLGYCVYYAGAWNSSQVPNISYTSPSERYGLEAEVYTYDGIDAGTPPQAIVFNGLLYVFYVAPTTETLTGYDNWSIVSTVAYSTFNGSSWSSPQYILSTAPADGSIFPRFVYPVVYNDTLYIYFMNDVAYSDAVIPGGVYWISTSDGSNWSSPVATTNLVYVPGGMTTVSESNLGTDINNTISAADYMLQMMGLPQLSDISTNVTKAVIGAFF